MRCNDSGKALLDRRGRPFLPHLSVHRVLAAVLGALWIAFGVLSGGRPALAADCSATIAAPDTHVDIAAGNRVRAGDPVEVRWSATDRGAHLCRTPLYLVLTTGARVRFEGAGFLAMPPGAPGPYGITDAEDKTRVFIPLHAQPEAASGILKIKFYTAGPSALDWFVTGVSKGTSPEKPWVSKTLVASQQPLGLSVDSGRPAILVRDSFTPTLASGEGGIEAPKKTIISNSGEFQLEVFGKFYRVYDVASGELVLERGGVNPNFSPSSRFLGSFSDGDGFEVVDLYADAVVVSSGELNRREGFEGGAHLAAWSNNDAIVALSLWGWGGLFVKQALVDGPGVGGSPSCHACQGIGVDLRVSIESGLVSWSGQERGWGLLLDPELGSAHAGTVAAKEFPGNEDWEKRSALAAIVASRDLADAGRRYLFDSARVFQTVSDDVWHIDGSQWHLGGPLQLSHACIQDDADTCTSQAENDEKGAAELKTLASHRVEHVGRRNQRSEPVQVADARLIIARAASGAVSPKADRNVWQRLEQLGLPVNAGSREDVPITSFGWDVAYDHPETIAGQIVSKLPGARPILSGSAENAPDGIPDYVDETHEIKLIDPKRVRDIASFKAGGLTYWLITEDYQQGNSATPSSKYLHLVSGDDKGPASVVDLSTRLGADGTLARSTDQTDLPDHPWPSGLDIVTIAGGQYLLASGQWLHDRARWVLAYDLKAGKTVFFNGQIPEGIATKALSITNDGKAVVVSNSNGRIFIYGVATGAEVLSGNYVDDELVVYDPNGYYLATYEGNQFIFMKFPGLPGYLSFRQFAKVLERPDVVKGILAGAPAPPSPDLTPPPRLALHRGAGSAAPGRLKLSLSVQSNRDLAALRIFIDGQLWSDRPLEGRASDVETAIDVPPQARWLTAVASDRSGAESVPVAYALPKDTRASTRKLFVVAVGTDKYANLSKKQQLRFAVSDARSFTEAAKGQTGGYYGGIETKPFLDAPDLKAELPKTLATLAQAATRDDTIVLFASGHGYRDADNKLYLVVAESDKSRLKETSLSWDELADALSGTKARIIVFIDACHSGAVPDGGTNDEIAGVLEAHKARFTIVAAAKGRQESFESAALGGGYFTGAIVRALTADRADTDSNHNGVIELSEVYRRIKPAVVSAAKGAQTPWLARADMVGEVPLF